MASYLLPIAVGAGLIGLFAYKKSKEAAVTHVPVGQSTTQLGQAAQAAAIKQDPVSLPMTVKDVQTALNQLGASPALAVDGSQGPKTTAAIKSFQQQAGLTADGIVGPQTASALRLALGGQPQTATAGQWDTPWGAGGGDTSAWDAPDESEEWNDPGLAATLAFEQQMQQQAAEFVGQAEWLDDYMYDQDPAWYMAEQLSEQIP